MGQPHSLAVSCPTGGGLATALQPSRNQRMITVIIIFFFLGIQLAVSLDGTARHWAERDALGRGWRG